MDPLSGLVIIWISGQNFMNCFISAKISSRSCCCTINQVFALYMYVLCPVANILMLKVIIR